MEQYIFCLGRIIKHDEIFPATAQPSSAVAAAADNKSSSISSKSSELDRLADNLSMMLESRDAGDSRSVGDNACDDGGDNGQGVVKFESY